jgi:hypothetical protein
VLRSLFSGWQRVKGIRESQKIPCSCIDEAGLRSIRKRGLWCEGSAGRGRGWDPSIARIEMSDLQATLEFSLELCKFYNVDLFQRG